MLVKVSVNLPARARKVRGGDLDTRRQWIRAGRSQDLFPIKYHAERAVREAGEQALGAGTVQVVGILDLDDDCVVDTLSIGDTESQSSNVGDLWDLRDRG